MCLFTHFAAGALAGGLTGNIWIAAAAGAASHAVLDALPHYDHPDWRVELSGGVGSLILLLLLPFVTAPAVVGGVFGVLPDLENLLQKLGKMRRDQFVFPSHTGLIPHGRTLQPASIIWQIALFIACFTALGLLTPASAYADETAAAADRAIMERPVVRTLLSNEQVTRIRLEFPVRQHPAAWENVVVDEIQWALPLTMIEEKGHEKVYLPPRLQLAVAVPTRRPVQVQVSAVNWWREPDRAVAAQSLVDVEPPTVFRSVPVASALVPQATDGGVLASLELDILHPPHGLPARALQRAEAETTSLFGDKTAPAAAVVLPTGLANPELYTRLSRGAALEAVDKAAGRAALVDYFGLTDNWVRLTLTESGLYRLTGQDLVGFGVPIGSLDPNTLRLFRGGGLPLDTDPEVPDTTQIERVSLNEVAIEVGDGGDGELDLLDEIRFYGFGSSCWLDRLDPEADRLEHFDHNYAAEATYWLTWERDPDPSPLPGDPRRTGSIDAATGVGEPVTTCRVRQHEERQYVHAPGLVADNWTWDSTINSSRTATFTLRTPAEGTSARYVVDLRGVMRYGTSWDYNYMASAWLNDDDENAASTSFLASYYTGSQNDSLRVRIIGDSADVRPGFNTFTLANQSPPTREFLALDSFDILYWVPLQLESGFGQLEFAHWKDQVAAPGTQVDLRLTVPGGAEPIVWDVTDPNSTAAVTGAWLPGSTDILSLSIVRDPDQDRHFVAATEDMLLSVASGVRAYPRALRDMDPAVDYVVIYPRAFAAPAQDLADFRNTSLPGVTSPAAVAVLVDDIYDNFSGGQKDILALRNFLRWVYESGGHRLRYVCFLGNTTDDWRNYMGREPLVDLYDLVPSHKQVAFPNSPSDSYSHYPYGDDDALVSFDSVPEGTLDRPDLACGRLPVKDLAEAEAMVARMIGFADTPDSGLWRNRVLFTADDMYNWSYGTYQIVYGERGHTRQAERLAHDYVPLSIDMVKLYGVDFDHPPGSIAKSNLRAAINSALSEGTTIFYYVGHGSEDNLADEQIFLSQDIANLANGMKRFVFMAFSCDVGVYDSFLNRSMAETFVLYGSGGAIGSVAASQVSYPGPNNDLSNRFFANLFPDKHVDAGASVGAALNLAKATVYSSNLANARRYNYFGDPATVLPYPVDDLQLAAGSVDTLRSGQRQIVAFSDRAGKTLLGAGDTYELDVSDSYYLEPYQVSASEMSTDSTFVKAGDTIFRGSGTMTGGSLEIPFVAPQRLRYGDWARIRLIVDTPDGQHAAAARLSAVPGEVSGDDVRGPLIDLAFPDGVTAVAPGTELVASLFDTSSIAILGTRQNASILLEFDDSGFMTDVTPFFNFDPDSYQSGSVRYALPSDLGSGRHTAAVFAADAFGNVGSDTLTFQILAGSESGLGTAVLFPNPTSGPCRLLFETGDPMEVQWDIYSLAGRRLFSTRADLASAGAQILEWDGRDDQGDEIANGTYLYVLRGWQDTDQGREINRTGKLVIMR